MVNFKLFQRLCTVIWAVETETKAKQQQQQQQQQHWNVFCYLNPIHLDSYRSSVYWSHSISRKFGYSKGKS